MRGPNRGPSDGEGGRCDGSDGSDGCGAVGSSVTHIQQQAAAKVPPITHSAAHRFAALRPPPIGTLPIGAPSIDTSPIGTSLIGMPPIDTPPIETPPLITKYNLQKPRGN